MSLALLRRRLGKVLFALLIPVLLVAPVLLLPLLLLPLLLPAALVSEALTVRKLARTRCATCGNPIGLLEVRRAQRERGPSAAVC